MNMNRDKKKTRLASESVTEDSCGGIDGRVSNSPQSAKTSRRDFIKGPLSAGAIVSGGGVLLSSRVLAGPGCADVPPVPSVRISKDVAKSLAQEPTVRSFGGKGITGAQVFAKLCKDEDLAAMFCAPGNYDIIHALADVGIPSYGGRTEGGMCAAADGFYRASGAVAACSGTEGPGFAHMIMGIGAASAARTPLLVLASNSTLAFDDSEAFIQSMAQQPITEGLKKYGKRILVPNRVYEYGGYAFRHLKSGVPGPVHLDFPGEITTAIFTDSAQLTDYCGKARYRTEGVAVPSQKDVLQAVELIEKARRPLLIAGQGVFHRQGSEALLKAAERNQFAVVPSGPMRGQFPDDHQLSMSLSPKALLSADLVIFVGQYCMPTRSDYQLSPDAKTIRVHPVAEDLGRNWPLELGIVGDERAFLEMLADLLPARTRPVWVSEVNAARKEFEKELESQYAVGLKYSHPGAVHPAVIGHEIHEFFYRGKVDPKQTVTGWGGATAIDFIPSNLRANRPGQSIVAPYQFGAIGPDIPLMLGAGAAVKAGVGAQRAFKGAPVLVYTSDAGMGYSLFELETAVKYKIPLIAIVYNNNAWSTWTQAAPFPRALHLHLFSENIRYDKMAEQLGVHGEYVYSPEQLRSALQRSYDIAARESLPSLINIQAIKEFNSPTAYPIGGPALMHPGIASFTH